MTESDAAGEPRHERKQRGPEGLSPVRAFFVVGAIAAMVPLGLLATRDEATPAESPGAVRSPDFSLTDAEAIAEFERLNAQLVAAYRERNIALAEDIFTSNSPMLPRVRKEINTLIDSSVVSLTRFRPISTQVLRNGSNEVELERIRILYPRFETESGRDVTGEARQERQQSQWILRLEAGRWLLHDATITRIGR